MSAISDPCPYDTNGDGDCGKPLCPYCGKYARATDRIRDKARWAKRVHTAVSVTVSEAEALCDLVDDVRAAIDHYDHCVACGDHTDNCRCDMSDVRATLARLDAD